MRTTLALAGLTLSLCSHAAIISHNGYSLDTTTNVVTGGGLQWLQWDETVGQSIDTALGAYAADGWRLASNVEMANLFNSFAFGTTINTSEEGWRAWRGEVPTTEVDKMVELFGATNSGSSVPLVDPLKTTGALFGADPDGNNWYNLVRLHDDYTSGDVPPIFYPARLEYWIDFYPTDYTHFQAGVALVRSEVPVPASAWLFASALIGLLSFRRKP